MTKIADQDEKAARLRLQAEEIARKKATLDNMEGQAASSAECHEVPSPEKMQLTLHELQVHQIELEMQNDELRRIQMELEAARSLYLDLFELAPVGYLTLDAVGNITQTNLTAPGLLGLERSAMIRKPLDRFIFSEDQDIFYLKRKLLLESGKQQSFEMRMIRKDGTQLWGHIAITEAKDSDGVGVVRVVIADITERKRLEDEKNQLEDHLRQAQKMETVGRLAGGVAHDFNNMLAVILGYAQMGLEQTAPSLPVHGMLKQINKAGEHSADLVRQLLTYARKQIIAPVVVDLNEVVENSLGMLKRLIGENIMIDWQPGVDLWMTRVDPTQVQQILTNLCLNARDALANGGSLTVGTSNDRASFGSLPGDYVVISVRDDGCGMEAETLAHIFEPFYTTKTVGKGTGLGLATVYGAVKQNDGFIKVISAPNKGTTFSVYLPRHLDETQHEKKENEVPAPDLQGKETILLVEDEPSLLDLTRAYLQKKGYKVLAAGCPKAALGIARKHEGKIDLLVSDVMMPEMNGRELAKRIIALFPDIKCLFMPGYSADIITSADGVDMKVNFIQKPFSLKDLPTRIRSVLKHE